MGSVAIFYVGGGCDGYCTADTTIVQTYARGRGRFFTHYQMIGLQREMKEASKAGLAIVVIGHSWGGSAILNLMTDVRTPRPDLLVSVDPVGTVVTYGFSKTNPVGGLWVNITATDDDPHKTTGNFVANLWGRTRLRVTSLADVQVNAHRVHEQFAEMLDDAQIPAMIMSVRRNAGRR